MVGAFGERNVVDAGAGACDAFERFEGVVIEFVHVGRTQYDGVGVVQLGIDGVFSGVEMDESNGRNLVHRVNFIHANFLILEYYLYANGIF